MILVIVFKVKLEKQLYVAPGGPGVCHACGSVHSAAGKKPLPAAAEAAVASAAAVVVTGWQLLLLQLLRLGGGGTDSEAAEVLHRLGGR
jgi:hypothetical protein